MAIIKNLRDIIILSIVLTSLPTHADYMVCDAGGNNCTNVHEQSGSTSSSGTTGTTQNQPASKAGGYQDNGPGKVEAYAQAAAAEEKGNKLKECGKQKALVPISQGQCKAKANTHMTSWSVQNCQESGGLFWPNFGFESTYFTFVSEYPKTQYSTYAQCEKLTTAAINQFQADCTSTGDLVVVKTCEAAGVK